MTAVRMLTELPLFQALGWSLLHFIWQGSLVAFLLLVARSVLQECGAHLRYRLAGAAMLLMLMLPLSTAWFIGSSWQAAEGTATDSRTRPESTLLARGIAVRQQVFELIPAGLPLQERLHQRIDPLLPWLIALWLTGVLSLSFRLCAG